MGIKCQFLAVTATLKNGVSIRRMKQGIKAVRAMPVHSFRAPGGFAGVDLSDHLSFWKLGLPAVLVTEYRVTGRWVRTPYFSSAEVEATILSSRSTGG